jgi:hypothetical protein
MTIPQSMNKTTSKNPKTKTIQAQRFKELET